MHLASPLWKHAPRAVVLLAAAGAHTLAFAQVERTGTDRAGPRDWTLQQVLATVRVRHPLIEAAQSRVSAARGERRSVGALPNPVANYQVENAAFPGGSAPLGVDREESRFLSLPLEPLFQRWPAMRRADEDVKAAEGALAGARRQVALDAARAFFRVALAQVSVGVSEEARDGLERLASFTEARVREGATAEGDLIRVRLELDRASADLALSEVELTRARAELAPYLGEDGASGGAMDSLRVVVPGVAAGTGALGPLDDVLRDAVLRRPDLVVARARFAAADADVAYQRSLTVRQVGATYGAKRIGGETTMLAGISIPLPLFDRNGGAVQRASGERVAAERELAWAERAITAEVRSAYQVARRLTDQVATLESSFLARAEEARQVTVAAYQEGAATLLQVLDATRALGESRLTFFRLLVAQQQSVLELAAASGSDPAHVLGTDLSHDASNPMPAAGRAAGRTHP